MDRKTFRKLPIEEQRKILKEQASNPDIQTYYQGQMSEPQPDQSSLLGDGEITAHQLPDGDYDITGLLQAQRNLTASWFKDNLSDIAKELNDARIQELIGEIDKLKQNECDWCGSCYEMTEENLNRLKATHTKPSGRKGDEGGR